MTAYSGRGPKETRGGVSWEAMRYYVLVEGAEGPVVIAETFREEFDDGRFRDTSLGSSVGGAGARIRTRQEALDVIGDASALDDWDNNRDARADAWSDDLDDGRHLRVVPDPPPDRTAEDAPLPAGGVDGAG